MSSNSSIKYLSKDERQKDKDERKESKKSHKDKKRKSEDKHKSKHKHKHKHQKKEKQEKSYHLSESESSVDLEAIANEELERERFERQSNKSDNLSKDDIGKSNGKPAFDRNRFQSLIQSLQGSSEEQVKLSPPTSDIKENNLIDKTKEPNNDTIGLTSSNSSKNTIENVGTAGVSNYSAAALLRERLKNMKGALKPSDQQTSHDIDTTRELLKVRSKYNSASTLETANPRPQTKKVVAERSKNLEDSLDVLTMKRMEQAGGDDMDEIFHQNIMRLGNRYKGNEMKGSGVFGNGDKAGMDEDDTELDMSMFQKKQNLKTDRFLTTQEQEKKEVKKIIQQQEKSKSILDRCNYCITDNQQHNLKQQQKQDLLNARLISESEHVSLFLKTSATSLVEGHCELVPKLHVASIRQADEEILLEIERYKSCLQRMWEAQEGQNQESTGLLFVESAVKLDRRHAVLDVLPLDSTLLSSGEVKMSFQQAFMSCDEEWSQHKKVIELTSARPLNRAIPINFQYLSVEWGIPQEKDVDEQDDQLCYGGLVHPVENTEGINSNFCLDVVAGLLEFDAMELRMKQRALEKEQSGGEYRNEQIKEVSSDVRKFKEKWEMYDWTQYV